MLSALLTFDHGRNLWRITNEIGEEVGTAVMVDPPTASSAAMFYFTRDDGAVFIGRGTLTEAAGQVAEAFGYDLQIYAGGLDDGSPELHSAELRATERQKQYESWSSAVLNEQVLSAWADFAPAEPALRTVDQDARVDGADFAPVFDDGVTVPGDFDRLAQLVEVVDLKEFGRPADQWGWVDGFCCSECADALVTRLDNEGRFRAQQCAACLECGAVHRLDVDEGWDADDNPCDVGTMPDAFGLLTPALLGTLQTICADLLTLPEPTATPAPTFRPVTPDDHPEPGGACKLVDVCDPTVLHDATWCRFDGAACHIDLRGYQIMVAGSRVLWAGAAS